MAKQSELSAAQRREAVLALLRQEAAAAVLARRFGIAEQTLYRGRDGLDQWEEGGRSTAAGEQGAEEGIG